MGLRSFRAIIEGLGLDRVVGGGVRVKTNFQDLGLNPIWDGKDSTSMSTIESGKNKLQAPLALHNGKAEVRKKQKQQQKRTKRNMKGIRRGSRAVGK